MYPRVSMKKLNLWDTNMKRSEIKRRPMADTVLTGLQPESKEYREHDSNGLYFRVRPDGSKSWQFRYKNDLPDQKWTHQEAGC